MSERWWVAALRWPLWSWRRLALTMVGALVLAWAAGLLQGALAEGPRRPALAAASSGPDSASSSGTTVPGLGSATLPGSADAAFPSSAGLVSSTSPPPAAGSTADATGRAGQGSARSARGVDPGAREPAAAAARRFVVAWARPDLPAAQWFSELSGLCTPRLAALLANTDPARVPAGRVLDPAPTATADAVAAPTGSTVEVGVATDAGRIRVQLVATRTGWLAESVAPDSQPPGGPAATRSPSQGG